MIMSIFKYNMIIMDDLITIQLQCIHSSAKYI